MNKTLKDFEKLTEKTKQRYIIEKMEYGREFTIKEETYNMSELHVFTIANHVTATKIIFDGETKHLMTREINMSDIKIINEMLKELNGDQL
jgi:D-alanine-D-alanine ligase-like ATP-grasp enzyme